MAGAQPRLPVAYLAAAPARQEAKPKRRRKVVPKPHVEVETGVGVRRRLDQLYCVPLIKGDARISSSLDDICCRGNGALKGSCSGGLSKREDRCKVHDGDGGVLGSLDGVGPAGQQRDGCIGGAVCRGWMDGSMACQYAVRDGSLPPPFLKHTHPVHCGPE